MIYRVHFRRGNFVRIELTHEQAKGMARNFVMANNAGLADSWIRADEVVAFGPELPDEC